MKNQMNENDPGILIVKKQPYHHYEDMDRLVRYVIRDRKNEMSKGDVVSWGVRGLDSGKGISSIISQMRSVQKIADNIKGEEERKRNKRRCFHEIYDFNENVTGYLTDETIDEIAYDMSEEYFRKGYQVVYAVHRTDKERGRHVHLVINTVNFRTGLKLHDNFRFHKERQSKFNKIVKKYTTDNQAKD